MKVEKELKMTLDEVNIELQILANEAIDARIDQVYSEFLEEMYQLFELEQYAADSYNLDAEFYGEM